MLQTTGRLLIAGAGIVQAGPNFSSAGENNQFLEHMKRYALD